MRFGELIALTWNEVDFDRGLLKTYRRFNTLSHKFVPPKNKTSIRMVPIDEECIKILQVLKIEQEKANKEQWTLNPWVTGSSPVGGIEIQKKKP